MILRVCENVLSFPCDVTYVTSQMAIGESGRVVLEIDPQFKREFYGTLTREGLTLKDWFLAQAENYIEQQKQPTLFETDDLKQEAGRASRND